MLSEVRKPQRVFTIEEATRTLPLVRRVVRDIVEANSRIERLHAVRQGKGRLDSGGVGLEGDVSVNDNSAIDSRIEDQVRAIDDCLREFDAIGCECKDFRLGLVDFPAMLDGRVVYLCWKLGESEVAHWHEVDGGFSGRKPVHDAF